MTEIADQLSDVYDPLESEIAAGQEHEHRWRSMALQAGRMAVVGAGLTTALALPAARAVTAVEHMPPTQVPMSVAGARVTAELDPGQDTMRINVAGNAMVRPLDLMLGRKHYGVTVNFDTANKAASLFTPSGSLDIQKLERIVAQFSDTTPQRKEIKSALESDIRRHALTAGGETLAIETGLLGLCLLQRRRRSGYTTEEKEFATKDRRPVAVVTTLALTAAGVIPVVQASRYYWAKNHHIAVVADPAFAGTFLHGSEVDGPLTGAPDSIIHKLDKNRRIENQFYSAEVANFNQAFLDRYGVTQLPKPKGVKRILFADDFQGIEGTTRVVGAAAKAYGADVIGLGGDSEDSNLIFVSVLDSLYEYADGIPVVMGTGPHDPSNIIQLARDHHFFTPNGKVQEVAGIDFLPVADAASIGTLAVDKNLIHANVTEADVAQQTIDTVRASKKPVIVLVHDSRQIGTPVAESDDAALVLQGRDYFPPPTPTDYGHTVAVTSGSTGGHTFGEGINVTGIIAGKASFKIIDIDEKTLQLKNVTTVVMDPVPTGDESITTPSTAVRIEDPTYRSESIKVHMPAQTRHNSFQASKR